MHALTFIATVSVVSIVAFPVVAVAQATIVHVDLPAQTLSAALTQFGRETKTEIVFSPDVVRNKTAPALKGDFEPAQALKLLLQGSGLSARTTTQGAVVVERDRNVRGTTSTTGSPADTREAMVPAGASATPRAASDLIQSNTAPQSVASLEEIVVTAQKRVERLQDVPLPVTAINADALVESNQLRLQDYFTRVPGLSVTPDDQNGAPVLTIRGITTGGYTNPTVGIVIDDVPYGASTSSAVGTVAPDIDPFDLVQVEVLRGPQGTLYGAGSMGGLIKYSTVDPSTDRVSGHVQAGTSSVYNGAQLGYNFRAAVNLPLSDTLAVRVGGFTRRDPGYIDNPVLDIDGVNEEEVNGAHLVALWRPTEAFSLRLSALFQSDKRFGSNEVYQEPGLGDLEQSALPNTGRYEKTLQAYSLTLRAKLGAADLTAISGFSSNKYANSLDDTDTFQLYTQDQFGVPGTAAHSHIKTNKFTQEVRLSAPIGPQLDWLLGAFYTYESSPGVTDLFAETSPGGQVVGQWLADRYASTYQEYAAFTDLTWHVTDRFDIQIGGRESQNHQTYNEVDVGLGVPEFEGVPSPNNFGEADSKGNAFTYLLTPRLKLTPDLMMYARVASGYRPGGPNPGAAGVGLPGEFGADSTQSYELGLKADAFDRMLSFDASLYYIDWKDIQVLLIDPNTGTGYYTNGNRAKSEGLELSVESRPLEHLTISAWLAWDNATLTEAFPAATGAYGAVGDRLPDSSRFSGNVSAEERFLLAGDLSVFFGGSVSYVGERIGEFTATPQRQPFPGYAQTDLHAGAKYNSWTLNLFVNNVTDKRGLLRGGLGSLYPFAFDYIQPRTVGLNLSKML